VQRLAREVLIWQELRNPRIAPLLGYIATAPITAGIEGQAIISLLREFGNLDQYLKMNPQADKLALLIQAAEAVNVLHIFNPNPIPHGDIKPGNFLVSENGEVEICDFGISRILETLHSGLTTGGGSSITAYQAPEIL
ncbi:hypothetical protein M407DRAFT_53183, partial [Tulasnella calospora MUT 4182]